MLPTRRRRSCFLNRCSKAYEAAVPAVVENGQHDLVKGAREQPVECAMRLVRDHVGVAAARAAARPRDLLSHVPALLRKPSYEA